MRAYGRTLRLFLASTISCSPGTPAEPTNTATLDAGADTSAGPVCQRGLPSCPSYPPSFAQTVSVIFRQRCSYCHYAGSTIANFDFSTYGEIHANRGSVLSQVYSCNMPPPDNVPLSPTERTALLTWLECEAPNN
jgi:hypothetical protein